MPTSSRRSLPHILLRTRRGRRPRRPACMNFQIMRRAGCHHPAADTHRTPTKTLSLRGAERRGNPYSLRAASHHYVSVGGGDCPPSCQPISTHCRGRQSGHFLETASLLPPPAALRRFPRPPMRCGIGKTGVAEPPPLHNFKKIPSSSPKTFRFQLSAFHVPHSPPNQQVFPYINRSHFSIPL